MTPMNSPIGLSESQIEKAVRRLKNVQEAQADSLIGRASQICINALESWRRESAPSIELPYFDSTNRDQLVSIVTSADGFDPKSIEDFFWLAFHLYVAQSERASLRATFGRLDVELDEIMDDLVAQLPREYGYRVKFLRYGLARYLLNSATNHQIQIFKKEVEGQAMPLFEAAKKVDSAEERLNKWQTRADELAALLQQQSQELNFVGLAHAFSGLIDKKSDEKLRQISLLAIFGAALLAVPGYAIHRVASTNMTWSLDLVPNALPFAVVELVLLYFFRIFLNNYYSLQAQLLQLQMRHSLCAFIEGYVDFASKVGERVALDKFEAQIFSGISGDPANVPSHFDGIEQLTKLVRDLRAP
jgi:hypothetical protein